jgi:hypothetical protein
VASSCSTDRPYLRHVKSLSTTWPQLRLLADFMEVSTSAVRWLGFKARKSADHREEHARRTNVMRFVGISNTSDCQTDITVEGLTVIT